MNTFIKLFHKKTREKLNIPFDESLWPRAWTTIFFKEYPRLDTIYLTKDLLKLKNLKKTLEQRTSSKGFDVEKGISIQELSTVLYFSAGIKEDISKISGPEQEKRDATRRFYPSGGARYPLEIYVAIKNTKGIEPGIYHYNVLDHSLEKLTSSDETLDGLYNSIHFEWARKAAAIIITTAVWDRTLMKYRDSGYNLIIAESGHVNQNIHLVSTSLDIKSCSISGFRNEEIDTMLDLIEGDESSIYITVLGR